MKNKVYKFYNNYKNYFYNFYNFYKGYIYNHYNRYKGYIRRKGRRYVAAVVASSMVLEMLLPFAGLVKPLQANGFIHPTDGGEALFENANPEFKVEFGDREEPTEHRLRFEAVPEDTRMEANDKRMEANELMATTQKVKETLLGPETKGIELKLVSDSLISSDSRSEANELIEGNSRISLNSLGAEGDISSNSREDNQRLQEINQGLEEVKGKLEEIGGRIKGVSQEVKDIVTGTKDVLEESGAGKPELVSRPEMENNPADFAKSAGYNNYNDYNGYNGYNRSAPPAELSAPTDTISQQVGEETKLEYQVIPGKGVKESITLMEANGERMDANEQTANNTFVFELTLDEGVQVRQSLNSIRHSEAKPKNPDEILRSAQDDGVGGTIYFVDRFGRYLFHFESPYMIDSGGAKSNAVALDYSLISSDSLDAEGGISSDSLNSNKYLLTLTADQTWLNDPARVFPVLIDPTIVHEQSPAFLSGNENRSQQTTIYKGVSGGTYTLDTTTFPEPVSPAPAIETQFKELQPDINTGLLMHFNDTAISTSVSDSSGNNNQGILTNGAKLTPDGIIGATALNGLTLDGSNDYVQIEDSASLTADKFTLDLWFQWDGTRGTGTDLINFATLAGKGAFNNGEYSILMEQELTNSVENFNFYINSAIRATWQANAKGIDYGWHHLAAVYDGAYASIYFDGIQRVSTAYAATVTNTANQLRIGAQTTGSAYAWDGKIDEVRFSSIARTSDEISAIAGRYPYSVHESPVIDFGSTPNSLDSLNYSASGVQTGDGEKPFSSDGLVAQWNLNETSGTAAYNTGGSQSCGGTPSSCNATLTSFSDTTGQDVAAGSGWTSANRRWGAGATMFDGTNDYAIVADNANLDGFTALSLEAWIKINKRSTFSGIFGKFDSPNNKRQYAFTLDDTDEHVRLSISPDGTTGTIATADSVYLDLGQWYHVAGTWDGTMQKIYVNGKFAGSATQTTLYNTDSPLTIGALGSSGSQVQYFNGIIDGVRVYNRALSPGEVMANAQTGNIEFQTRTGATSTPNDGTWEAWRSTSGTGDTQISANDSGQYDTTDANMVSYWKLDGNATDAKDSNNGTITEATSTNGRFTTAYNFDGSNDVITVTQASNINLTSKTAYTMEAWFKADTDGEADTGQIVQKGAATFIRVDTQGTDNTLDVEASFDLATTDATLNITDATRTANWTHVALTYEDDDDDEITLYINGVNMGSSTNGVGSPATETNDLLIGGTTTANFDGVIDEVAVWNDARTAAEIAQDAYWAPDLINNAAVGSITTSQDTTTKIEGTAAEKLQIGAPQVDASTVGLWHMEETSGTGAYIQDATANNNDGTPTGTTVVDGFYGKGRSFTAASDTVSLPISGVTTTASAKNTISFWSYRTSNTNNTYLQFGDPTTNQYMFYINYSGSCTGFNTQNADIYGTSTAIPLNQWVHMALVVNNGNPSGNNLIYVNGVSQTMSYCVGSASNSKTIGTTLLIPTSVNPFIIDEVQVSNVARSAEEIAEQYRAGRDHRLSKTITSTDLSAKTKLPFYVAADRPGTYLEATVGESAFANYEPDANTVGLWHLEEQTGTANTYIKDSSGSGNNSSTITGTTFVQGKIGKARNFNGSSDYVSVPDSASWAFGSSDFTIETWVRFSSVAAYNYILGQGSDQNNNWLLMYNYASDGLLRFISRVSNDPSISISGAWSPSAGAWYHLSVTRSGNNFTIYVNGNSQVSSTSSGSVPNIADSLNIGRAMWWTVDGYKYFPGIIDEVRISNTARSADEIRQAYEIGKRTHPVTVDFNSQLDASNLITGSADYTFALSSNIKYQSSNINLGEKIIVRENVGGTEYIAQGTVSNVTYGSNVSNANAPNQALTNAVSTSVTVTSWDSGSTFPTGGFTLMASVFKWQREFMDLTPISLTSQRDAVTRITLRVTDGSQGSTVWLDDFESADYSGGPMTGSNSASLAIGSTVNRYFQYRAVLTNSPNSANSPNLTNVQINYNSGTTPQSIVSSHTGRPPDNNTLALWRMEEGTVDTCPGGSRDACDSSRNSKDLAGTSFAAANYTSGKVGTYSVTLDGNNDYLSSEYDAHFNPGTASFSVEGWFKHDTISGLDPDYLISRYSTAAGTPGGWKIYMDQTGDMCFGIDDDGTWDPDDSACTTGVDYDNNQWHHLAAVKNGTTSITLYIDGEQVAQDATIAATATLSGTTPTLYVGSDSPTAGNYWTGEIDEVHISNSARSQAAIRENSLIPPKSLSSGSFSRITNTGSDVSPSLELSYQELPVDNSTVGLWHMNEVNDNTCSGGEDTCDSSGNANHGTFNGNAAFTSSSRLGSSATTYDGNGDFINVPDATPLKFGTGNFTLEAWVYVTATGEEDAIVSKDNVGTSNVYYKIYKETTEKVTFAIWDGTTSKAATSNTALSANTWYHVAGVRNGDSVNVYVNGVLEATTTGASGINTDSTAALKIGAQRPTTVNYLTGSIDEVRISNIARTPEEIKADAQRRPYGVYTSEAMNLGTDVSSIDNLRWTENGVQTGDGETPYSSNGLVAAWNFNETSGTTAANNAGTGSCGGTPSSCNGTLTSFASTSSQDQAAGTGWTANNRRWGAGALMFDGSNDYVTVSDNSALDFSTAITMEAWFKKGTSAGTYACLVDKHNPETTGASYQLCFNANDQDRPYGGVCSDSTCSTGAMPGTKTVPTLGQWHQVVVTYDQQNVKIYLDGVLENSQAFTGTIYNSTTPLVIGANRSGTLNYYNGVADGVRVYSRALSASEILSNYQSGNIELQTRTGTDSTPNDGSGWEDWKPASSQGSEVALDATDSLSPVEKISQTSLTAYWKLDETSGTRADSKGSNTLTDNNTVTYAPGRLSNAADFESGNSEYLSITDNADTSWDGDLAIAYWFNAESFPTSPVIVDKYDNSVSSDGFTSYLTTTTGRPNFYLQNDATTATATWGSDLSTNTWYFVYQYFDDSANTLGISVNNGPFVTASFSAAPKDSGTGLGVGGRVSPAGNYFDGMIDDVAFWKRTLTAAERTRLFEDGLDLHGVGSGRIYRSTDTTTKIEGTGSEKLSVGAPQVDSSTVALWHLDETSGSGAYIQDATANNNDGTPTGTSVVDGFYGKGRSFNGTSDHVAKSSASFLTNTQGTAEGWFKLNNTTSQQSLFVADTNAACTDEYNIWFDSSIKSLNINFNLACVNSWAANTGSNTVVDNSWHHIAVTSNGSTVNLYLDGVVKTLSTTTGSNSGQWFGSATNANTFEMGVINRASPLFWLNGNLDEVRISNVARSAEEIAEAYRAGRDHRLTKTISSKDLSNSSKLPYYIAADRPGTYLETTIGESSLVNMFAGDSDLKGYWPLDENSTGAAAVTRNDYSGNGNNLTDNNTTPSAQGKIGKASNFTSANSEYLSISDNAAVSTGDIDYSIATWVYLNDTSANYGIVSKGSSTAYEYRLILASGSPSVFNFLIGNGSTGLILNLNSTVSLSAGNWYFVVAYHDSVNNIGGISVNGALTTASTGGVAVDTAQAFWIGRNDIGGTWYLNGKVDETMFIKRVLTPDEQRQLFEIGKRTHPITIDFATAPSVTCNSCTTLSVTKPDGVNKLSDVIAAGETIIAKENVSGTEYIAQATVTAVDDGQNEITIAAAFSSQPSGGYTTAASLFKWQREFFELPDDINIINAISFITLRVTDGNEGRTVWLDDFRSAGPYLSVSQTRVSSVVSAPQQFFQYRIIFSTSDAAVSPSVTSISVQYHSDPGKKVLGADTFLGPGPPGGGDATLDTAGNMHLGDSNVNDVYFYDRTKDQISYALETDGSNDYVDIGTGPTSVKTVEFWVYPETTTEYFINLTAATDYIWVNVGTVTATGFAAPIIYVNGAVSSTLVADKWQHVAVTDTTAENASNFDIGRTADANYLEGKIDEVVLYDDVRTAAEVADDMNARRLGTTDANLVALYHFDEGSGTRAFDSDSTFHGTLTNMTDDDWVNSLSDKDQSALSQQVLGVDPNWPSGPARQSYALDFDGTDDRVNIADNASLEFGSGDFTVEAWVKFDSLTGSRVIIGKYRQDGLRSWIFQYSTTLGFYYSTNGSTDTSLAVSWSPSTNTWYHTAAVRNGSNLYIYVDGAQLGATQSISGTLYNSSQDVTLGAIYGHDAEGYVNFLDGRMDEVAIFTSARTAAQISSDFSTRRLKGNETGLVGLWHIDEGTDNTCSGGTNDICDSSSNGFDGAKNNMSATNWLTDANTIMDNNGRYVSLGSSSAVNTDRGMELKITSTTAFQYRWQGDQTWTTPATSTLSSYSFTSPAQIDSTGVYVGFDTTNGVFGDESYFLIPSWALEQFSSSDTNNAMRGTKRGFPERSYLIATDKGVDILNADDNTLWMRAEQGSGRSLGTDFNNDPSSLFAVHGSLYVGTNGSAGTGLYRYDFNRDKIYRYDATDRRTNTVNIAKRNTADSSYGSADTNFALVNSTVNDVHATVSEGKLYIATATDAGLDVIQDSQTNTYSFSDVAGDDYNAVWLASYGDLFGVNETQAQVEKWSGADDNAADELAGTPDMTWDEASTPALSAAAPTVQTTPDQLVLTQGTSTIDSSSSTIYYGHGSGVTQINTKGGDENNGSVKYLTKDYVTEEMIGNVSGFWPLNETSGTRTDQSVKTNDLTDNNTVTYASGVRGTAAQFTRANSEYLSVTDNASLSTGDIEFTVGAWVYHDSLPSAELPIISKNSLAANDEYLLEYIGGGTSKYAFYVKNDNVQASSFGAASTGTWNFVVGWRDKSSGTINIQVNNGTVNSTSYTVAPTDTANALNIGTYGGGAAGIYFDGRIDEVLFTKEVLTAAQRTQLYVAGREALNNKYRATLDTQAKDLLSELAGDDNTTKAVAAAKQNQTGVTRPDAVYIGTNGSSADDGRLSKFITDIRVMTYDETSTEPYVITDNDISSLSVSSDGAYIIVGSDDSGVTIIQNGSTTTRLRGGSKVQGPSKRPHN